MSKRTAKTQQSTTTVATEETKVLEGTLVTEGTEGTEKAAPTEGELATGDAVANNLVVEQGEVGKQDEIPASTEGEIVAGEEVELHPYCETILEYAKTMGPNVINPPQTVIGKQMELYQAINGILNNFEGAEFVRAYGQALDIMATHKASFADNLLFRGMNQMRVPPQVRQRYENILILMSSTAEKEGRKAALEAISIDVLCKDFSNDVEQKLKGFYR